ncbi:MAG TPA: ABC transporter permease [Candidatus Mcinerneyibacteriales bacterium]|nr:ABC transporter permease [Candidatus Mcinerneyibacteriales bacterium]HPJ69409.1 ABC transporter permease [Candidatus Mcinerneyibacteriales bacterium]HPQ88668.1 ABC transporter permease [Candidatus Mcinerneyibacteriales bacterium]
MIKKSLLGAAENVGRFSLFVDRSYRSFFPFPPFSHMFKDLYEISVRSLPIIILVSAFMGIIMSYQLIYELRTFGAEMYVGGIVAVAVCRELGPVFAAMILAGRLSSGIAAEVGTMRISEQIDALEVMSVNPLNYLVAPRLLAALVMIPMLTVFADAIAIAGSYLVAGKILHIHILKYIDNIRFYLDSLDILSGLIKSMAFSQIIVVVGSYFGYFTQGGAEGVGKATTNAVVVASILILVADYFLTALFFG